jgi:hypothetical protein
MKNAFFHTQNAIIKGAELCASSSSSADVVSHIKYSLFARESVWEKFGEMRQLAEGLSWLACAF